MSLCSFETRKDEVCHESGITDTGFQVTQKERERKENGKKKKRERKENGISEREIILKQEKKEKKKHYHEL